MGRINLSDFFQWFDPKNVNHLEAVDLLEQAMPETLLRDKSAWVLKYREPVPEPEPAPWPITKEQMGYIMGCSSENLSGELMNDFARCVQDCEMDTEEMVHFLGQCGHESCGLRYPVEIHDGSDYEGRSDLGNTQPGDGVKFAGTGYIQVTGRYNHQQFSDHLWSTGRGDPKVMSIGKTYTCDKVPLEHLCSLVEAQQHEGLLRLTKGV